jgi:predicted porin
MKRILLTGTALATAAMLTASPASAEIKVSAYIDAGIGAGSSDEGVDSSEDGHAISTNSEIHFKGSGKTDAGLEYGLKIEAEGDSSDNKEDTDAAGGGTKGNIDETVVYISGAFGRIDLGQEDNAADPEIDGQVYGVAGQAGAFDTGMANLWGSMARTENALTDGSDANMIMYTSPRLGGVQAKVSYAPGDDNYLRMWGGNVNTSHKLAGVGVKLNATGVYANLAEPTTPAFNDLVGYTIGAALDWEGLKFEVGYLREHNGSYSSGGTDDTVFDIGVGYGQGPWAVNVEYRSSDENVSKDQWEWWGVGASYNIAKGLTGSVSAGFGDTTHGSVASLNQQVDYWLTNATLAMSF